MDAEKNFRCAEMEIENDTRLYRQFFRSLPSTGLPFRFMFTFISLLEFLDSFIRLKYQA